ncbi:MAG: hypothetical protein GTO55_12185 [Armatimonadetes bacterium]|nr:hypothetical protein [Armatimonadota bacterium]NIM24973.1 hypothetical protein [Armatimonadota bacterium]NIM68857.1 hypothetical protein [Armatimonadota bacterium]NIN07068.1 hypothetical protein [Armatimonadota bacterium]NIO99041.1 hypothetical protein [Armatimonadota bacterium]
MSVKVVLQYVAAGVLGGVGGAVLPLLVTYIIENRVPGSSVSASWNEIFLLPVMILIKLKPSLRNLEWGLLAVNFYAWIIIGILLGVGCCAVLRWILRRRAKGTASCQ